MFLDTRGLAVSVSLALAGTSFAQDWKGMGRLEGRVTDAAGAPVAGATVKLELPERGGGTTVRTDKKGRWALGGMAAGSWNVDVEAEGFAPRSLSVRLPSESSRLAPIEVKLEKAQAASPDPAAQGALSAAEAAYAGGRYADARTEYVKLLGLRPDLAPRIHQQIGFAWIQEKQHAKAVEELKQVLAAEPDNHRVRAIAAQAALEGGMLDEGRSLLAALPPDAIREPDVLFNIAVAFVNAGATEDAIQFFTRAIARDPGDAESCFQRGLALVKAGRTAEARADFQRVVELAPPGPRAETARKALEELK
jgi:tetratricopeptide (TPR) repeat protein